HRTCFLQRLSYLRNSRCFLTGCDIYTIYRLSFLEKFFLIDDRIDCNCRLPCLSVTNDQLTLTTANGYHGVNSFDTCLQRFINRLAIDNSRSFAFQWHLIFITGDRTFTIDGLTKWIYYPADKTHTYIDT